MLSKKLALRNSFNKFSRNVFLGNSNYPQLVRHGWKICVEHGERYQVFLKRFRARREVEYSHRQFWHAVSIMLDLLDMLNYLPKKIKIYSLKRHINFVIHSIVLWNVHTKLLLIKCCSFSAIRLSGTAPLFVSVSAIKRVCLFFKYNSKFKLRKLLN